MLLLRPYQVAAIDRARETFRAGKRRVLIHAPTGAGKTVVAARIVASAFVRGRPVLLAMHRRELIAQTVAKLEDAGIPASAIGVMMADDKRTHVDAPIQVASIQTFAHRSPPPAALVVIDEAHRAKSPSYTRLVEYYEQAGAVLIGLTATPIRADGSGLGDVFEAMITVATPRELITEGFLTEPRVFSAGSLPDLTGVQTRGGDYVEHELSAAMMRGGLVGNIVEHWKRLANGQRTVAFAASVEHSQAIAAAFVAAGIPAEHLDGETPTAERDAILGRLETGETLVVSNCAVLCEGWDMPCVKVAILARPTKSLGLFLQCSGRILRPWNDVRALILDHAGNALRHGLPQDDREFSLDGTAAHSGGGEAPTKTCPSCDAVVATGVLECPECGAVFERSAVAGVDAPGELVEVLSAQALADQAAHRRQLGLCSLKQSEQLRRRGLNPDVSFEDANVALAAIARNGWRTPADLFRDPRFRRQADNTDVPFLRAVRTVRKQSSKPRQHATKEVES